MIDPSLAFQTAIRTALISSPDVTALVDAASIRSGSTRPGDTPCIVLSGASTEYLGRAAGDQRVARVSLDLHIWAIEGADVARQIGAAVSDALIGGPEDTPEIYVDEWEEPSVVWLRDPQPEKSFTHGIVATEAVVRWRV